MAKKLRRSSVVAQHGAKKAPTAASALKEDERPSPLIRGTVPLVLVSILPIAVVLIVKLLQLSLNGPTPEDALDNIKPEFWNLSLDLVTTAVGIFFGSVLFAEEIKNSRAATIVAIIIFALFFAIIAVNTILPHANLIAMSEGLRIYSVNFIGLICLAVAVQTI
jgi:hypothetical protein